MPVTRRFAHVDVFTREPLLGNGLAVVVDAEGLDDAAMAAFARWTNQSETTFLLPPTDPAADYRVRIFTPGAELPFAGHPTLGSCAVWLAHGGVPKDPELVVQECGAGRVRIRREPGQDGDRFAFAAPALIRSGPADAGVRRDVAAALRLPETALLGVEWVDNGPGWVAALLDGAQTVIGLEPDFALMASRSLEIGVIGRYDEPPDGVPTFEVRAFTPGLAIGEDPVTGSLNAGLAQWLIGAGLAPDSYRVYQGTAIGRAGRVQVDRVGDDIWVGGAVTPVVAGTVTIEPPPSGRTRAG